MHQTARLLLAEDPAQQCWEVWLPFQRPLSLNDRQGHWAKARAVKLWREETARALTPLRIPACERVRVELTYFPKVNRRRDPDNLTASYKPCVDAVVDAGIVPDDTQEFVERVWPWIGMKTPEVPVGRFLLVIERLE